MGCKWGNLVAAVVLGGLASAAALAEPIAASRGRWTGVVAERTVGAPGGTGRIELRVDGTPERFTVELAGNGVPLLSAELTAGKQKDVFGPPAGSALMSYLGRGSTVNPLEGKPLAWARREGERLVVYRLDLSSGVHRLDRLALSPSGERMGVDFERREHERLMQRFTAELERSGR